MRILFLFFFASILGPLSQAATFDVVTFSQDSKDHRFKSQKFNYGRPFITMKGPIESGDTQRLRV